jgi:NAD(P)-dependent dehydrogenase (short-subunit alcohol dehydrogenase family)
MRARGRGTIVNMSSLGGRFGMPFSGLYSASKFALEGLSEALRLEVHPFGVRVVLIEPGDFQSQFTTARRNTRASGPGSAYAAGLAAVTRASEKDERNAPTPEPIARLLERVLRARSPALRYSVGMLGQRVVLALKWLLPARLFEWVLRQAFQIADAPTRTPRLDAPAPTA